MATDDVSTIFLMEIKQRESHYREILDALLVPTNFISIEAARSYICEAIETYGLGEIEWPKSI